MLTGIRFPSQEIGSDRAVIRDWALQAAGTGFSYLVVNDHVVGVDPDSRPDYGARFPGGAQRTAAAYSINTAFHEPLTTIAHLSALCPDLGFSTGVLVCPQRQTALVAKQAAQADILSGGRLRLGIGVGWNPVEYEAMGAVDGARATERHPEAGPVPLRPARPCGRATPPRGRAATRREAAVGVAAGCRGRAGFRRRGPAQNEHATAAVPG
ncbi:LLM class flavin-dependent oxidoreductase [Kitasatospora sp. NPDC087271]|uniref:LLM class flavin-dependent oxidoreductase n=1 Tax=Kitasatospora sp. NPDC087271 TaxID=3364067 RepID=UPI0038054955